MADNYIYLYYQDGQNDPAHPPVIAPTMSDLALPLDGYATLDVHQGGTVSAITIGGGATLTLFFGSSAHDLTVLATADDTGCLYAYGATVSNVSCNGHANFSGHCTVSQLALGDHSQASVNSSELSDISLCGQASLNAGNSLFQNLVLHDESRLYVRGPDSILTNLTVLDQASAILVEDITLAGDIILASQLLSAGTCHTADANLTLLLQNLPTDAPPLIADWNNTPFFNCTAVLADTHPYGTYAIADNAANATPVFTIRLADGSPLGTCQLNNPLDFGYEFYSLTLSDNTLSLHYDAASFILLSNSPNLQNALTVKAPSPSLTLYFSPECPLYAAYWKITADTWKQPDILAYSLPDTPCLIQATCDGIPDILFATPSQTWNNDYCACHATTGETYTISEKNRFYNLFLASQDPALLILTDDDHGDALFADDIFTEPTPDNSLQLRFSSLNEIRCGDGPDLIDLTTSRFSDSNPDLIIRGGNGDDTLWAADDGARLFGDQDNDTLCGGNGDDLLCGGSGDDTLRGGSGSNLYAFGENWGHDTVILSPSEDFRLWFDAPITRQNLFICYDDHTAVISSGDNSLTVQGCATDSLDACLIFGEADQTRFACFTYAELVDIGAFAADTHDYAFYAIV